MKDTFFIERKDCKGGKEVYSEKILCNAVIEQDAKEEMKNFVEEFKTKTKLDSDTTITFYLIRKAKQNEEVTSICIG